MCHTSARPLAQHVVAPSHLGASGADLQPHAHARPGLHLFQVGAALPRAAGRAAARRRRSGVGAEAFAAVVCRYGRVRDISVRGDTAVVEYDDSRDAEDAVRYLNGYELDGSRLAVDFSRGGFLPVSWRVRGTDLLPPFVRRPR